MRKSQILDVKPSAPIRGIIQKDVALALGLSQATVSMALRNDPRITPLRCMEIQKAAEALGYRPNPNATMLAHFKKNSSVVPVHSVLAWINAWLEPGGLRKWHDFDLYWQGATRAAEKFGYRLEEFRVNEQISLRCLQRTLLARNIRGILIPPHGNAGAFWSRIDWSGFDWGEFSVVRFGHTIELPVHCVTSDQTANAMLVFNKIRERGYTRVAFVGRKTQARLFGAGFLWANSQLSNPPPLPLLLFPEHRPAGQMQSALASWLKKVKPDAILSDVLELPEMLKKAGYRLPEDIGLAATTTLEYAKTAIDAGLEQNSEEVGRVAVLVVLSLISDNARGLPSIPRQTLVEGRWVDGLSLPASSIG